MGTINKDSTETKKQIKIFGRMLIAKQIKNNDGLVDTIKEYMNYPTTIKEEHKIMLSVNDNKLHN